jgi:NADPH-dependent curcumin reductase CurA
MISQYNLTPAERYPITNLFQVVGKRLKMQGFIVSDANMGPKYFAERGQKMTSVS